MERLCTVMSEHVMPAGYGKREAIVLCDRCLGLWYNVHVGNEQCHEVSMKKWQLADNFF